MKSNLNSVESLPVLPELAYHILEMALGDDVSIAKLSGYIEKDQSLTARILSLANSSYYRRARTIYTVHDAVVTLGLDTVKTFSLGLSVVDMFPEKKGSKLDYRAFWRHTMASAIYARAMMKIVDEALAGKAFGAAMLHGIGKVVLDHQQAEKYAKVLTEAASGMQPLIEVEQKMLGTTHAEVGRNMLIHWGVPKLYAEVIWCYHAPVKIIDDNQYLISGIVHMASTLADMTYTGAAGNYYPQRISAAQLKQFGLSSESLDEILQQVPEEVGEICEKIGIGRSTEGLFQLINRATVRLSEVSGQLRQRSAEADASARRAEVMTALLRELNRAVKVSELFEQAAGVLQRHRVIDAFLGGIKKGACNLVYEAGEARDAQFSKVSDDEVRKLILNGNYPVGTSMASGIVIYMSVCDEELAADQAFISEIIDSIAEALNRIQADEGDDTLLRRALINASHEKQRAEEMLGLSRELMDASLVGLCLLDDKGRIMVENDKSREIRSLLGLPDGDLAAGLGDDANSVKLARAIAGRQDLDLTWEGENTFRVISKPLTVNSWSLLTMWDMTSDLEKQRRMFAYAKMSAVGNLAASMAHNMKSPLGALQGFSSIIREDLAQGSIQVFRGDQEDVDFHDMVQNMVVASENVLAIVNQLLTLSRKWEAPADQTDIAPFVDGILKLVTPQATAAGVNLKSEIAVESAYIRAQALEQVLINLLMNAIAASSAGNDVCVKVEKVANHIQFMVIDHGIGIDSTKLDKIFEPLYTDWASRTGMGLGLALVKDILESMDGSIRVESKPGDGSTFKVDLVEER